MTLEERRIWLKIRLFGFHDVLVSRSSPTVFAHSLSSWLTGKKLVFPSTLIGPFKPGQVLAHEGSRGSFCHCVGDSELRIKPATHR